MPQSRNAKGTIIFSIMLVFGSLWLTLSPVFEPPWEPWEPLLPLMSGLSGPFMTPIYRPLLIALTGLAVFWVWDGKRIGYVVAFVLALVASGFGVIVSFANLMNQTWRGAFTALCALVPALLALWYSYRGYFAYDNRG